MRSYRDMNLPEFLKYIQEKTEIAIVGGYIRDCLFGYTPKDIDIITESRIVFDAEMNRYGGHKLTLADGMVVDIWSVQDHMGPYGVGVDFNNIVETLLFNIFSCVYYPKTGRLEASQVVEAMRTRTIDLTSDTPLSRQSAYEAKSKISKLSDRYGLRISYRLQEILSNRTEAKH